MRVSYAMFYIFFRYVDSSDVNNHLFVRLVFPMSSPGFDLTVLVTLL